jgi:hypothetical protein
MNYFAFFRRAGDDGYLLIVGPYSDEVLARADASRECERLERQYKAVFSYSIRSTEHAAQYDEVFV